MPSGFRRLAFVHFFQQLLGRNIKRIALDDSADEHDRMRPQGINDHGSAEFIEVVGANHDIPSFWQGEIHTALVFEQAIRCARVVLYPRHVGDETCYGKTSSSSVI